MKPLAISGFTATSALGRGCKAHYEALKAERGGLRHEAFESCTLDTWVGAVEGLEAPLPPALRAWDCRNNRLAELGLQQDGFLEAVAAARRHYGPRRIAVYMGTSTSGVQQAELAYQARAGTEGPLPDWFDYRHTQNTFSIADFVRVRLELDGPCAALSAACASSAKVFASAARALQSGIADAAVVGGVDSLCLTTLYGFNALQLLSRNVCRPADAARDGLSLGEAAGFALLERDATSATQLLGYGESNDAYHMSSPQPDGRGAREAMVAALARGNTAAVRVDYVNLHGTGTPANDLAEDKAVAALLGREVPCSSTKGWTGHTLGAAGALEAALTLLCLQHGWLPRSLNTQAKDLRFQGNVLLQGRSAPLHRALSNSFGFGGANCSLLFGVEA
ncbi:MAG TPA: beta-ketoacyl-ACP synthase [Nevskiaceae bacterium]|nr:beta-ketoacyl-ACP synthase [Nevskiaceae bacterium]